MYKTTQKDFVIFKEEALKWVKYLGLIDWDILFEHEEDDSRAYICYKLDNKIARIGFSKTWDYKPDITEVKSCAFHEVIELLLARLMVIGKARFCTRDEFAEASHDVIRRLENTIFKDFKP